MKIFGWMQCKLRNNSSTALLKDTRHGNANCTLPKPSWNDQQGYLWAKNGTRQPQNDQFVRYLRECTIDNAQEDHFEETFPGFLTIGTLNMESVVATEPGTPTFEFPANEEASQGPHEEEVNYELKLINDELERFLKEEAEHQGFGESRRLSVASTITLSGKDKDDTFPLQGYLFASSYDLPVSEEEAEKDKEKSSLLELFRRSREIDRNFFIKLGIKPNQDQAIRKYKAPLSPMRRIFQTLQHFPKKIEVLRDGASTVPSPTGNKFRKMKQLFQKKVHPNAPAAGKERKKGSKYNKEKKHISGPIAATKCRNKACAESGDGSCKSLPKKKSNVTNVEHWIRTDADYLVLELGEK